MLKKTIIVGLGLAATIALTMQAGASPLSGREYHVSVRGDDANDGSVVRPLRTISAAAALAQSGDLITVHQGVYRERINPPRGGESYQKRIVYQAAAGDRVVIKGSEIVRGWRKVQDDTWTASLPNSFFGEFNPYDDLIRGDWFNAKGRAHHTGAVYLDGHWLTEAAHLDDVLKPVGKDPLWFAQVDEANTTIWAQFKGVDPNQAEVEINVRRTVFYPEKPGVNYITVRGLVMMQAATPWAPPTAEQVGLIGTHWSKGWILENNDISYSTCVGITMGKYGDQWDNTSQNTAEGYVKTIERALGNGWSKENIGGHLVRNNRISHCEQAGIVGSLGAIFSTITGNVIHDIHVRQLFSGAEMAGIKIHAAIDTEISRNHIYHTCRGIWLDWMAQGTRVTGNLLHDNAQDDLFVEVNHGPFLVDNNLLLSKRSLLDMSEGGAYVHNLFAGRLELRPELRRSTPFHKAHSTEVAGLRNIQGGDDRFYNNLLIQSTDLTGYAEAAQAVQMAGNLGLRGAKPRARTPGVPSPEVSSDVLLTEEQDGTYLQFALEKARVLRQSRPLVTTALLGLARISGLPYEEPNGLPYSLDLDYLGSKRNPAGPCPGPFELAQDGKQSLRVWPVPM
jgi:alpha-N-arabinofuranosidase